MAFSFPCVQNKYHLLKNTNYVRQLSAFHDHDNIITYNKFIHIIINTVNPETIPKREKLFVYTRLEMDNTSHPTLAHMINTLVS